MKRVYLLILVLVAWMAIPAQAQFKWGIKGGANISSIHFSDLPETFSTDNLTGFHIGPTIELMAPFIGLGFDASILYSQTGMEIGTQTVKSDYLNIPVNLKWKIGIPAVKVFAAAGPYVGFRLGGGKIWDVLSDQIESKSFSAGLNIGAGVELIQHLQISATYQLGLTDNYSIKKLEIDGKNRGWLISAAILF